MAALVMLSVTVLLGLLLPSSMANNVLYTYKDLLTVESLTNENYKFEMQSNCNLVLSDNDTNRILWSSNTTDKGHNCFVRLQANGDLVIFNGKNEVVYSSNTAGKEDNDKYILFLYPDGHIIIYEPKWTQPNNTDNYTNRKIAMVTKN
ncbi:mannose-specific lectin-like [Zingiber officinale]|nr:mannose-specific lectin-like [Zingiber officinale]